jgi:hypothetical protein
VACVHERASARTMSVMRAFFALVLGAVLLGCGARPRTPPADCGTPIRGTRAQLTLVSGQDGAPTFDEPVECATGTQPGAYIRVTRAEGARTITFTRRSAGPCDVPDADPTTCPDVSVDVLGMAVLEELRKELGELNADGFGLGACADHTRPLMQWNLGSQIHDWQYADRAVETTDATLARWNVRGECGVSVTRIECAYAE